MGNGISSWLSSNYPILIIAVAIMGIIIYSLIRQYRAKKPLPAQKGEQPRQATQESPKSKPKQPAPTPQPAPAKTGFGVGIFNGAPVAISKMSGKVNGWVIEPMKYKDYAQCNDEVGKLALLLAAKLRDYENLRSLMAASKEARDILVKANVEELDPIIQKLQSAIERVEETETSKGEKA